MSAVSDAVADHAAPRDGGERPSRSQLVPWLLAGALSLPLLVYASVGAFSRYVADDYCWAGILRTQGFLKAQALWYTGYSPRYAFTFIVNVVELAGPAIVPALPATAMVVWVATLTWALVQARVGPKAALLTALAMTLATLQSAPDMGQSLYWQTGMLTYVLPLVLAVFLAGWIVRALRVGRATPLALAVSFLVTVFAGGLSETYLIPQNVVLTLALVATLAQNRRGVAVPHLAAALAGGVAALAIIVVAPATNYRLGGGTPADLWLALSAAIATAAYQVLRLLRYFPLSVLMLFLLQGVARALLPNDWPSWRPGRAAIATVTAIVAIALPFCYFPSFYAQNGNPPARSLIVPGALLTSYTLFIGYVVGDWLQRTALAVPAALALVAIVPLAAAFTTVPQVTATAAYANQWDVEDALIRANRDSGQLDVTVPALPPFLGENFVTADRANWFNVCVARYYGVRTIAAGAPS